MGTVFEGVHSHIEKRVALKVLSPAMARDENHRARFLNEARAAARISSPHVVGITDYGRSPITFVVMEFLEGEDLSRRLAKTGPLDVAEVLTLLRQICAGLEAAHKKGVVHRDIKPSNIFLAKEEDDVEVAKILDFGIAKLFDAGRGTKGLTRPNETIGTAAYMSPEQILGAGVDRRSDIYSLGVVLFRMLVGTIPFRAENGFGVMEKHVRSQPPALNIDSPEVESVVLRCLEKSRERRFPDVGALLRAFEAAVQSDETDASGACGRTLVPFAPKSPANTEVTGYTGAPPAAKRASTEPILVSEKRTPTLRQGATEPSADMLRTRVERAGAEPSERSFSLRLGLVLACSMVVGGAAFAWQDSTNPRMAGRGQGAEVEAAALVLPHRDTLAAADPVELGFTPSIDLPALLAGQATPNPEPLGVELEPVENLVEVEPRTEATPLEEPVPAVREETPTDVQTKPPVGKRGRRGRRGRNKRPQKLGAAEDAAGESLERVVEAMLKRAQKAALSDQAQCFQLAAEAHEMRPSQRAAVVMTKCACRLGDAEKANTAARLLSGKHPNVKKLCELKGVELAID